MAWDQAGDTVGAVRWRPVATTLFVAERHAPWAATSGGALAGAAIVSLLLHVFVALGVLRLVAVLGGDWRAALLAGLLVAAAPVALSVAAWPARQATVLATALALLATLVALRGGALRLFLGGGLLALAGLAHEAAFGWVPAVIVLRGVTEPGRPAWRGAWPCAVLPIAAFALRSSVLGGLGVAVDHAAGPASGAPNFIDGLTGAVRAFVAFAVPSRLHFADGPFTFPFLAHLAAVAALVAGCVLLVRTRRRAAPAAALAALLVLSTVPLALLAGAGIAPYQDAYLYLVLPLLAAAAGIFLADLSARAGPARISAVAAAALLVGASVAATVARAPSFRTRGGLIALAKSEMPKSIVVRTWDVAARAGGRPSALSDVAAEVNELARDAGGSQAPRLRNDTVASATVSRFLGDYASRLAVSPLPLSDAAYAAADAAGEAAAVLRLRSAHTFATLAKLRRRTGALRGAREAIRRAIELAPNDVGIVQIAAETALSLGDARFAADLLDGAHETMRADPKVRSIPTDFLLLYARALAADGALRVPDPSSDRGLRYRFDLAADVLIAVHALPEQNSPTSEANTLLYDVYLRYGDLLAAIDRTAMALIAYQRAVDCTRGNPKSIAAEHASWLRTRLAEEEAAATKRVAAADAEPGKSNIANALVELYVAFCRQGRDRWDDADELFAQIERGLNGVPAELRFKRAVERYAALDDDENQARAETELRQVLLERPALVRAHFELARVLEWQGTIERLAAAKAEYERAAKLGALEDWSLDALDRARVLGEILRISSN